MEVVSKTAADQPRQIKRLSLKDLRERAIASHKSGNLDNAIASYKACLKINASDVGLWSNLGAALRKQKHYQSAVNCYIRALTLAPDDVVAMGNLANAYKDLHRLDEALALHRQVIGRSPNNTGSLMNYACALREAGEFEQALATLDSVKNMTPDNAGIEWERAQNLLYLGRYAEGWQAYEARWHTGELSQRQFPYPQWQGEALQGKRLLLHTEQGYGDTILAVRCIPLLKAQGAIVTLQCKQELHRLFQAIGADEIVATEPRIGHPTEPPKNRQFDYHCPLMSLMAGLNITLDNLPAPAVLAIPDPSRDKFAHLSKHAPGCLKVGIVWSGSVTFSNNENRAVTLEKFLPLAEIPNVRLYSLQKGLEEKQLYDTGADCVIENLGRHCEDFADTAAAIEQLDVIVMTDSSVAHLSASMGKPVINLLQRVPYWLYTLAATSTPWYPSMQLIKQTQAGQWADVFEQAYECIRAKAATC